MGLHVDNPTVYSLKSMVRKSAAKARLRRLTASVNSPNLLLLITRWFIRQDDESFRVCLLLMNSRGGYILVARTLLSDPDDPLGEWASTVLKSLLITDASYMGSDAYLLSSDTTLRFVSSGNGQLSIPKTCRICTDWHARLDASVEITNFDPDGAPVILHDQLDFGAAVFQLSVGQTRVSLLLVVWRSDWFDLSPVFSCWWFSTDARAVSDQPQQTKLWIQDSAGRVLLKEQAAGWKPFFRVSAPAHPGTTALEHRNVVARIRPAAPEPGVSSTCYCISVDVSEAITDAQAGPGKSSDFWWGQLDPPPASSKSDAALEHRILSESRRHYPDNRVP
jgi:hypothetical protein